jgi:hypothetical protein
MLVSAKLQEAAALASGIKPMVYLEQEAKCVAEAVWTL